jgi:flagellin-specific chaperone FliS
MMARKTDEERLRELEEKMEQMKARKQQVENRMKEKERKERTRRLIQVGAIFEKYFDIVGVDQAEKIAFGLKEVVEKNKEKLLNMNLEKSKEELGQVNKDLQY